MVLDGIKLEIKTVLEVICADKTPKKPQKLKRNIDHTVKNRYPYLKWTTKTCFGG
jgi:hypothetical protein